MSLSRAGRGTDQNRSNITHSLTRDGVPKAIGSEVAARINGGASASPQPGANAHRFFGAIQYDFAQSTKAVHIAMAGVMALSFVLALRWMEPGIADEVTQAAPEPTPEAAPAPTA